MDKVVLVEFYVFCGHFGLVFSFVLAIIYIFIKTENYILLGLFSLYIIGIVYKYQQYIRSIKAYRKIDDELKINLNNYFSEAVQGQTIIRAFNKLNFKANELVLVDIKYSSVNMIVNNIDSLIKFLLSFTSTLFLVIVLVGYFYARYFSQYEVFLLLNILTLEEYL